ncbi:MAG: hypothetical protein KDK36_08305, partial [Leptospiraceae bacterium]|nr:hypothetical protein [Leptospiraceae bacterium]
MKIYVNEQELNSTLEKEQNLGEVYEEVKKWAESQGKFLLQCLKDGNEAEISELSNIPIGDAERLDFYIGENLDILVDTLLELDRYIDVVGNTLFGRDSLTEKETSDLKDGVIWINEVLVSAKNILKINYDFIYPIPDGRNVTDILNSITSLVPSLTSLS